jgi:ABC-type lipoprotein release transport system permease subunit/YHS domain-containing protein
VAKAAVLGLGDDGTLRVSPGDRCPVCAVEIAKHGKFASAIELHDGTTYYFCGTGCMMKSWLHPEVFLGQNREQLERAVTPEYFGGTVCVATSMDFMVRRTLPAAQGLVDHDLVFMHQGDARSLLGLAPNTSSDLAVWVFLDSEMEAIQPDLRAALSFPAAITTRRESLGASKAQIERAAGRRTTLLGPALLALVLLASAAVRIQHGGRGEMGLLKSLGWTTSDLVRLHSFRALLIGAPAVCVGWTLAYAVVFLPELGWASSWVTGSIEASPNLMLTADGAALTLIEVGSMALAPYLAAVVFPVLRLAGTDPERWLRGEGQ